MISSPNASLSTLKSFQFSQFSRNISLHAIEDQHSNLQQAVEKRRSIIEASVGNGTLKDLPFKNFNYEEIKGASCENVIGYVTLPVGVAGPLIVDGKSFFVPLATTEGALVASANRGCKAISESGGTKTIVLKDGISRGPAVRMASLEDSKNLCDWVEDPENFKKLFEVVRSTSPHITLKKITCHVAGRLVFLRFVCNTGDAMGMNMVGVAVEKSIKFLATQFTGMEIVALSGNLCTDKKSAAINWIEGRGKSVVAEAVISKEIVKTVLKTTPEEMVVVNRDKNLIGSSLASTNGGNNAHAANMIAALFIATGQDPAQVVDSSMCLTSMEVDDETGALKVWCSMPALELGTVGGGTRLTTQAASLNLMGLKGSGNPAGANSQQLAKIAASTVLAGEISLIAALSRGDLMKAHLKLNRKVEK